MPSWSGLWSRLLPDDPYYEPFGVQALQGLSRFPMLLAAFVAVLWATRGLVTYIAFFPQQAAVPGAPTRLGAVAAIPLAVVLQMLALIPMLVAIVAALNGAADRGALQRFLVLAAVILLGAAVFAAFDYPLGCLGGMHPPDDPLCRPFGDAWLSGALLVRGAGAGALIAWVLHLDRRDRDSRRRLHDAALRELDAERQDNESHLAALQAQIEPHFLFNTLAHVEHLLQNDRVAASEMLDNFTAYLGAALPEMRASISTLERELALVEAYLRMQQVRMGPSLQIAIERPAALLAAELPSMLVLTLVENSIKHGIAPRRTRGSVSVHAAQVGDRLVVDVRDDGLGLAPGAGSGRGLANTRARLRGHYGAAARLSLGNRPEGGVQATLTLPLRLLSTREPSVPGATQGAAIMPRKP